MAVAISALALLNAGTIKLSVLLLYWRIFEPSSALRRIICILIVTTVAWMLVVGAMNFLLCIPLHAYWDILYTGPQWCLAEIPYFVSFSAFDLALDFVIYILPLPRVVRLTIPRREKWVIVGVFGVGIL
jgi:hypothetical protein